MQKANSHLGHRPMLLSLSTMTGHWQMTRGHRTMSDMDCSVASSSCLSNLSNNSEETKARIWKKTQDTFYAWANFHNDMDMKKEALKDPTVQPQTDLILWCLSAALRSGAVERVNLTFLDLHPEVLGHAVFAKYVATLLELGALSGFSSTLK